MFFFITFNIYIHIVNLSRKRFVIVFVRPVRPLYIYIYIYICIYMYIYIYIYVCVCVYTSV